MIIAHGRLAASDTPENLSRLMSGDNVLSMQLCGTEDAVRAAEKELKEELAAARSQNAALKQELDGAKDQLEVALKENATLKQELDGTKDQLEVALKQNQETAEKSQTARKK